MSGFLDKDWTLSSSLFTSAKDPGRASQGKNPIKMDQPGPFVTRDCAPHRLLAHALNIIASKGFQYGEGERD